MSRKRVLQPVVGLLKQQLFPSETPITSGVAGARQYVTRFKLPKVGSVLSGSQSALIVNFLCATNPGVISLTGLLNCVQRASIYIGSHRVVTIQEAGRYLNHKLRTYCTADELVDRDTYRFGVNDRTRLTQTFSAGDANINTSGVFPDLEPSLQIFTTAGVFNYQLQLPLNFVFDLLDADFPVYLLGSSDLMIEMSFDLTVLNNLIRTTNLPTDLNITSSFIYSVYYTLPVDALQRNVSIPFTDVFYTSTNISAQQSATQSFSLNGQKVKRLMMMAENPADVGFQDAMGDYYSRFIDSGANAIQLQLKYLDEQYFTENILTDTELFNYTNDCGKYGFVVQAGQFSRTDAGYLSAIANIGNVGPINITTLPYGGLATSVVAGGMNVIMINFGKVPYSHPLIEMPEMKATTMDNHPVQVLLRVQNSANTMTFTLHTHAELMKVLILGFGSGLTVN